MSELHTCGTFIGCKAQHDIVALIKLNVFQFIYKFFVLSRKTYRTFYLSNSDRTVFGIGLPFTAIRTILDIALNRSVVVEHNAESVYYFQIFRLGICRFGIGIIIIPVYACIIIYQLPLATDKNFIYVIFLIATAQQERQYK